MKGFFEGLQTAPIAEIAPGYGLEVLGPHVRRQEVDKRCLENVFLRYLALVQAARQSQARRCRVEQAAGQVASRGDARAGQRARTGGAKKRGPLRIYEVNGFGANICVLRAQRLTGRSQKALSSLRLFYDSRA